MSVMNENEVRAKREKPNMITFSLISRINGNVVAEFVFLIAEKQWFQVVSFDYFRQVSRQSVGDACALFLS